MVDDAILAYEAALMYQRVAGFQPENNSLFHWKGYEYDRNNEMVSVNLKIPDDFPSSPPQVTIRYRDGETFPLRTKKVQRWRRDYHLYQVAIDAIREVRVFSRSGAGARKAVPQMHESSKIEDRLTSQIQQLKMIIQQKEEELRKVANNGAPIDAREVAQSSLQQLALELADIEDQYDDGEIDLKKFCNKWLDIRTRYLKLAYSLEN